MLNASPRKQLRIRSGPLCACHYQKALERIRGQTSRRTTVSRTLVPDHSETPILNFVQLRQTFPHADQVGKFTVFDVGGNKVRLIAAEHNNRNKIYIRHVLTHEEYDTGKWKK
jgi:mRNA-degrading endonuclease HigB of HigAB toxin-antitoxin module